MKRELMERERGKANVSIGTSLALESLMNISDEIQHATVPLHDYDALWVNVKTLWRNLFGAVAREHHFALNPQEVASELLAEMEIIKDICRNEGNGIKPIFYLPDYAGLENINDEVLLRMDNTDLQKAMTESMKDAIGVLLKHFRDQDENQREIITFKNLVNNTDFNKALMLTHYAYDLTAHRQFRKLMLVESHTGRIKGFDQWYSKYYNGKDLVNMPFRLDLLTLLGDQTLFRSKTPAVRRELIQMSVKNRWSSITTASKIRSDAQDIKNHLLRMKILASIRGL